MVNQGSYLRVLTPRTSNGVNLIIEDGQVVYKEINLPMSAKRHLEEQNRKLPDHLKKIIEVVSDIANKQGQEVLKNQNTTNGQPPAKQQAAKK